LKQEGLLDHDLPVSLQADIDTSTPLYFWQIHSVTGQEPLFDICSDFYDLLFEDDEAPWFKEVFLKTATKDRHIFAQAAFWIDAGSTTVDNHDSTFTIKPTPIRS
jgi:hypothetical protein